MTLKETVLFVITGILATLLSLIGFQYVINSYGDYSLATITRWVILLITLYIGYSRFVLITTLRSNREKSGIFKAELLMLVQVSLSVGGSFLVKIIFEPVITQLLLKHGWPAILSPILADFVYGPIVNYSILHFTNKLSRKTREIPVLLPNPKASLSVSFINRLVISLSGKLADLFSLWKYPRSTDGCFENMSVLDKLYWIYKAQKPISFAERNENIEGYLAGSRKTKFLLRGDFKVGTSLTLSAVGDLMQNDLLVSSGDTVYQGIWETIFGADISFANLEAPLTKQEKQDFIFSEKEAPPIYISQEQFDVIKGYRDKKFTIMSTACNHSLDYGLEGLETTIKILGDENILHVGTNLSKEDQKKTRIIEVNNIKVGFIAFTFGLNGKKIPEGKEYCINIANLNAVNQKIDLSLLLDQIEYCRENRCDVIIASLHWGKEYEFYPTKKQIELSHYLIEKGVDAIISHHPHVIQPVEYYRTKRDPDKVAVICYSLGNLINPFSDFHLSISLILNLSFIKGTIDNEERTYINDCLLIPAVQRVDNPDKPSFIYLEKLTALDLNSGSSPVIDAISGIVGDSQLSQPC